MHGNILMGSGKRRKTCKVCKEPKWVWEPCVTHKVCLDDISDAGSRMTHEVRLENITELKDRRSLRIGEPWLAIVKDLQEMRFWVMDKMWLEIIRDWQRTSSWPMWKAWPWLYSIHDKTFCECTKDGSHSACFGT